MKENKKDIQKDEQFLATLSNLENELKDLGITENVIHMMHNIQNKNELNRGNVILTLNCISNLTERNKEIMQKIIEENNFDKLVAVISKTVAHIENAT